MCIRDRPVVWEDLVREFKSVLPYTVLLARVNGKYEELTFNVQKDAYIEFLDIRNHSADLAYQNSLSLMYIKVVRDVICLLYTSSSSGLLLSRIALAFSGSSAHLNCSSQSRFLLASLMRSSISLAPWIPFAMSAA